MELEKERGITIASAATYAQWKDMAINIIDTPGHVDFTVEVERALRVLDGAVLVLCGVSGVQSQSITVDRQMKRYSVPRIAFINKLDRQGANPTRVVSDLRTKLHLNAAAVQLPVGLEDEHAGVIDVIERKQYLFAGAQGETVEVSDVPEQFVEQMEATRLILVERLADVDEEIGELFLMEEEPTPEQLHSAIRRATIALKFVPVFMGSAFKNKGVQPMLDGVVSYLPHPDEVTNIALDRDNEETEVRLQTVDDKPLVALAFKLEESRFGQLTYFRIYQGKITKGDFIYNVDSQRKVKVPRLVRMHANEMEDITTAGAGEIVATFGVECASGETFTDGTVNLGMTSMYCPEPVISYAIKPTTPAMSSNLSKALNRFQREDPTFRVHVDKESGETIISGMGELHLDIYVERMKREYNVTCTVGEPRVNYRETIQSKAEFSHLHKKQSGGAGQYAHVIGYVEPLPEDSEENFEFVNAIMGNAIPPEYINACKKGFEEALDQGALTGHPVEGVRVVLTDGQDHPVDSSEMAFKIAARQAFREGFQSASPAIKEPLMKVEIEVPTEFQGTAIALVNKRKGTLTDQQTLDFSAVIEAEVPLANMFGFSTDLRSSTQGKGEFSMEYKRHAFVLPDAQAQLIKQHQAEQAKK